MHNEEKNARARVGAWLGAALSALGVLGVIALAVSDHRHRAVLLMVAVLVGMGALRLWTPGRPWFASRARLMDVAVYVVGSDERNISSVIFAASIPNPGYRFKNS